MIFNLKDAPGIVGNGVADDTAAIQQAFNEHRAIEIPDCTFRTTGFNTGICTYVRTAGPESKFITETDGPVITIALSEVVIEPLMFIGDGKGLTYDGGKTNQHAILISNKYRCEIMGPMGKNLGGSVVRAVSSIDLHEGNKVIGGWAQSCNMGILADVRGEYLTATGFTGYDGHYGLVDYGGNFNGSACKFSNNRIGVDLRAGENDSHGVLSASPLNHNLTYAIRCVGIGNGFTFNGCCAYAGDISVKNSLGFRFQNGQLSIRDFYFENSFGTVFSDNLVQTGNGSVIHNGFGGTQSQTQWIDTFDPAGAPFPV